MHQYAIKISKNLRPWLHSICIYWSLWMDKTFDFTLYNGCIYLPMLGLKWNRLKILKKAPGDTIREGSGGILGTTRQMWARNYTQCTGFISSEIIISQYPCVQFIERLASVLPSFSQHGEVWWCMDVSVNCFVLDPGHGLWHVQCHDIAWTNADWLF